MNIMYVEFFFFKSYNKMVELFIYVFKIRNKQKYLFCKFVKYMVIILLEKFY